MRQRRIVIVSLSLSLAACSLVVDADGARLGDLREQRDGGAVGDGSDGPTGPCATNADCDDGDPCTGEERCDAAAVGADPATGCLPGTALSCDDGISCTKDRCEAGVGCAHTADSTRCVDDVACTIDVCDLELGCQHQESDSRCDFCRTGSTCSAATGCVGGSLDNACTDGNECTVDTCDVASRSCRHVGSCESGPDRCEEAEVIELDDEGRALVGGVFSRVTDTYTTTCSAEGSPDAVYRLAVPFVADIVLDATLSVDQTTLAIGTQCDQAGFGLACADLEDSSESGARLVVHRYDPQKQGSTLFVLAEAADRRQTSEYLIEVSVTPVAADQCDGDLLTVAGDATILGFMDAREPPNAWGESAGSCHLALDAAASPEAVLRIPNLDGRFTAQVSSDEFAPVLYARDNCDGGGDNAELACGSALPPVNAESAEISLEADEDEVFLFVDGGRDGAPYLLRTRL